MTFQATCRDVTMQVELSTNKSKFYGRKPVGRFTLDLSAVDDPETYRHPRDVIENHMEKISSDYEFFENAQANGVQLVKLAESENLFDIEVVIDNIGGWYQRYDAILCGEDVMRDKEGNPVKITEPSNHGKQIDLTVDQSALYNELLNNGRRY